MKTLLGKGNSKLNKTAKELGVRIFNFSIPAYKTSKGKMTCPFAKDCVKFCYAQKGAYAWSNTQQALENRYDATKKSDFVERMVNELSKVRRDGRQIYVRIHDSGDFYSKGYLNKWIQVAEQVKDVRFYAYTKSHGFIKGETLPENLDVIMSLGSKLDSADTENYRHAKIFNSKEELEKAGYIDTSKTDLYATKWYNETNKVGLIIH